MQAALQEPATAGDASPVERQVFGTFRDSRDNAFDLWNGLRDSIVPGWERMLPSSTQNPTSITTQAAADKLEAWDTRLADLDRVLSIFSGSFKGKRVLEIGAHDGGTAYAIARRGAEAVVATDVAAYYINQAAGITDQVAVTRKNDELARLRSVYRELSGPGVAERVTFFEDDISRSSLPSESVDLIVSWEVLEHLTDPVGALSHMHRVLRPGGLVFHEYNPFFCLNGGHSLCTLDFLWGHARMDDADFRRYVHELRPAEEDVAPRFYTQNLNRMDSAHLKKYVEQAGLRMVAHLPFCSSEHLSLATNEILGQVQALHPSVGLLDLVTPSVWILATKSDAPSG